MEPSTGSRLTKRQVRDLNLRTLLYPDTYMNWPSFEPLAAALHRFFIARNGRPPVIFSNFQDFVLPSTMPIDLVLYSDGSERLRQRHLLPKNFKFRIWVLSHYSRRLLLSRSTLRASQVGVVPRYELYRRAAKSRPWPKPNQTLRLVFSGRIEERDKNFDLACATVAAFERIWNAPIEFHVCGPALFPPSAEKIITSWNLNSKTRVWGDLGQDWIKSFMNAVLLNLSTYDGEDFSVVTAQAQEKGWPLLLSKWGALAEVHGRNVAYIPISLIKRANKLENRDKKVGLILRHLKSEMTKPRARSVKTKPVFPQLDTTF